MLTKKQIKEIKEHLERAQNPIFFYDNDEDGLCSFILLRRYIERGKGVCIKSYPSLTKEYFRKVHELNADYIFILDKPIVSEEFFEEAEKYNIPVVWIDHHKPNEDQIIPKFIYLYNPMLNKDETKEPVTYLCYKISNRKEDLWLAMIGCIADKYFPDFYNEFKEKYPELFIASEEPFKIYYKSKIGELAKLLSFALKDRVTNVVKMQKFLIKVKGPHEVLQESKENMTMHYRFKQINQKYQKLLKKASEIGKRRDKILFFKFGGDLSISASLSNELCFLFPKKIIVVAYEKGDKVNLSLRGEEVRGFLLETIKELENAVGGGHRNAVGGAIRTKDWEEFKKVFRGLVTRR